MKRLSFVLLCCLSAAPVWSQDSYFHATNPRTGQWVSGTIYTTPDANQQYTLIEMQRTLRELQEGLEAARRRASEDDLQQLETKLKAEEARATAALKQAGASAPSMNSSQFLKFQKDLADAKAETRAAFAKNASFFVTEIEERKKAFEEQLARFTSPEDARGDKELEFALLNLRLATRLAFAWSQENGAFASSHTPAAIRDHFPDHAPDLILNKLQNQIRSAQRQDMTIIPGRDFQRIQEEWNTLLRRIKGTDTASFLP
jgi:hypothetical protein